MLSKWLKELADKTPAENWSVNPPTNPLVQAENVWYIHGKPYDLRPLMSWHPGGEDILKSCQGNDCTELFESSHALSSRNIRAMLPRFLLKDAPEPTTGILFEWRENGFYAELARRVRSYFDGKSHKATWAYWMRLSVLLCLYGVMWYAAHVQNYATAAVFSGTLWMLLLFYGILHDASHQALSSRPFVNKFWSVLTNHWGWWHHHIWLQHHVYGHHSFTGVAQLDPDVSQFPEMFRKHAGIRHHLWHKLQHITLYIIFVVWPNQYVAQIIAYTAVHWRKTLFRFPIRLRPSISDVIPWGIQLASLVCHVVLPVMWFGWTALLVIFLHWTAAGITYFLIVAPNHDTEESLKDGGVEAPGDWGEHQVTHSSNFSHGSKLLTMLFGGMNYQIEHHLFPTVCNIHYPAISKIVKQLCAERNIHYPLYPSLAAAHASVFRSYKALGKVNSE